MTSKSTAPLHVLRGILRFSKSPPLSKELAGKATTTATTSTGDALLDRTPPNNKNNNNNNALQRFVLERYRQHQHQSCEKTRALLHHMALNYYQMKQDLVERGRLYKLDTGAEMQLGGKEMSRRAAARAGLQLPKLRPDLE